MIANELRIGNFLWWSEKNSIDDYMIVKSIGEEAVITDWNDYDEADGTMYELEALMPIPITEEWLERFGFEVEKASSFLSGKERRFKVYKKDVLCYNTIQKLWWIGTYNPNIKHVHQLQNLCHDLTGEELTLHRNENV